ATAPGAQVVVLVDTSASQANGFRDASVAAAKGVLAKLRTGDRVRLYAADVTATPLSDDFGYSAQESTQQAISKLEQRLPLGNTNLAASLDTARRQLASSSSNNAARSIIYIGDGVSFGQMRDEGRFGDLVDALRADKIAVHSIVIGPTNNAEMMGTLANQTGGNIEVLSAQQMKYAETAGKSAADAATTSPIWIASADLPEGLQGIQTDRLPPLRFDRDSVLIGHVRDHGKSGMIQLRGNLAGKPVVLGVDANTEASNPEFSFLPGFIGDATKNGGLFVPTAGSHLLRDVARISARRAQELADASVMALQNGNDRGAAQVAEAALKADYENPAARSAAKAAGQRLVAQFDDLFGD
ncbi:MAG: VWA domain-containing protein, partial [Planctomycetota bacterium]